MILVTAAAAKNISSVMENKMTEERRQSAKEEAILLALQHDMALIRRDLEIHGIKKDGSTKFISKSTDYDVLWENALQAIIERFSGNDNN